MNLPEKYVLVPTIVRDVRRLLVFLTVCTLVIGVALGYLISYTQGNRRVGRVNQDLNRASLHLICSLPSLARTPDCHHITLLLKGKP